MVDAARNLALTAEERRALLISIEKMGERAVLAELNVSRQALGRALAGLGVRRGTIALVRAGIASPNLRAVLEERDNHDKNATCSLGEVTPVRGLVASGEGRSTASRRST